MGTRHWEPYEFLMNTYLTPAAHLPGWLYAKNWDGYGYVRVPGMQRQTAPHLYVCTLVNGPCPPGMEAAHNCPSNRGCFWAEHLVWKTHIANLDDRVQDQTLAIGERNGRVKLTEDQVRLIRKTYECGRVSQKKLSEDFGVTQNTIHKIITRKNWNHI